MLNFNPIVAREFMARWRGLRAFTLLFLYSAALAGGMAIIYTSGSDAQRAAERGHALFQTLDWVQTIGWMLIAPALTATAISGERERGLLEQTQLSRLTPWRIVWGKLQSVLLLIGLMLLVPLPVIAICFFTGGVSPSEFAMALALHAATATSCAAIGLFCSAWSRRSSTAMIMTFALIIGWNVTTGIAVGLAEAGKVGAFAGADWQDSLWALLDLAKTSWLWSALDLYAASSPVIAQIAQIAPRSFAGIMPSWAPGIDPWMACLAWQCGLTLGLLWLAALALRKPFAEQYWAKGPTRRRQTKLKKAQAPGAAMPINANPDIIVEVPRSNRWDLPFAARLSFDNPVLQREIRSKLRLRRFSPFAIFLGTLAGAYGLYLYAYAVYDAVFLNYRRYDAWWNYTGVALFALSFVAAVSGAGAFTREREMGTAEPLLLSTLPHRAIVGGKLATTLLVCLACLVPLAPLMLPAIGYVNLAPQADYGVAPLQAMITPCLLFATVWCYTIWGMLLSWLCQRTAIATVWTLGSLFALDLFLPALIDSGSSSPWLCWNPFVMLSWLSESYKVHQSALPYCCLGCMVLLSIGGGLLALLIRLMRYAPRESDHHGAGGWLRQTIS